MYYQELTVAGEINDTILDDGLVSPMEAPRTIKAVLIDVDTHEGNVVEGWIGTERVMAVYDYVFSTREEAVAFTALNINRIIRLPVDLPIPAGQIFKIGIRSGGVANDIFGAYEYEPTT